MNHDEPGFYRHVDRKRSMSFTAQRLLPILRHFPIAVAFMPELAALDVAGGVVRGGERYPFDRAVAVKHVGAEVVTVEMLRPEGSHEKAPLGSAGEGPGIGDCVLQQDAAIERVMQGEVEGLPDANGSLPV